ncbi:hypothetical protein C8R48DRAFT_692671 [Suillus tomentosus]|nr:hypothetical protein C8R48DRAFT_692671 [Suillus tomentosus]
MFHMPTICILLAGYIHSGRVYPSCISVSFACTLCATYNSDSYRLCTLVASWIYTTNINTFQPQILGPSPLTRHLLFSHKITILNSAIDFELK